jgi:hypothetical protein
VLVDRTVRHGADSAVVDAVHLLRDLVAIA